MRQVDRTEAESLLARHGWLSQQPKAFQLQVLRRSTLTHFARGATIYRAGDRLGGLYGIVAGAVLVTKAPPGATPRLLHVGLPGSWIGEGPFLVRERRRVGLHVALDCWAMHLPLHAMDHIASQDPLAVRRFTKILMLNLDILGRAFYDLQHPDASRRVALALLRITAVEGSVIPLSQADLGVMSNTLRKQVNAASRLFSLEGWVRTSYRRITLVDPDALRRFAERES